MFAASTATESHARRRSFGAGETWLLPPVRRPYFGTCGLTNRSPGAASSHSIRKVVVSGGACSPHVFRLRREPGEFCRGGKRRKPSFGTGSARVWRQAPKSPSKHSAARQELKCGGFGTAVLPHLCRPRSKEPASALYCREGEPPKEVKLPRRRPTHSRSRREAGFRARRPSRLHQRKTDGVTPLANAPAQETR